MKVKQFLTKQYLSVAIIWLFHISALVGITLGYVNWFIEKTPLNLLVSLLLFLWIYPLQNTRKIVAFTIFFVGGMVAEWVGVHYSLLFGVYTYGDNFGPKLDGIPLLIGGYWALLTFITASIATYVTSSLPIKIILAAALMTFLDYFMEHSAARLDFWEFEGGLALIENYITWFILALLFQGIFQYLKIVGNRFFSIHLYSAQLLFFLYLFFLEP